MSAENTSAARASEPQTLSRLALFALALAATCAAIGIVVGWIYAVVVLPGAWRWVFAFGSMIVLFAWLISGPQEEGGW